MIDVYDELVVLLRNTERHVRSTYSALRSLFRFNRFPRCDTSAVGVWDPPEGGWLFETLHKFLLGTYRTVTDGIFKFGVLVDAPGRDVSPVLVSLYGRARIENPYSSPITVSMWYLEIAYVAGRWYYFELPGVATYVSPGGCDCELRINILHTVRRRDYLRLWFAFSAIRNDDSSSVSVSIELRDATLYVAGPDVPYRFVIT